MIYTKNLGNQNKLGLDCFKWCIISKLFAIELKKNYDTNFLFSYI